MAVIQDLPQELLDNIIELCHVDTPPDKESRDMKGHQPQLSLVAKAWVRAGQRVLCAQGEFYYWDIEHLVDSRNVRCTRTAERFRVNCFVLPVADVSHDDEHLPTEMFTADHIIVRVSTDVWPNLPAMGVKKLSLEESLFELCFGDYNDKFRLERLAVETLSLFVSTHSSLSTTALRKILSVTQPTLKTLELDWIEAVRIDTKWLNTLCTCVRTIERLVLVGVWNGEWASPLDFDISDITQLLSNCLSLTTLGIQTRATANSYLHAIPTKLVALELPGPKAIRDRGLPKEAATFLELLEIPALTVLSTD